MSIARKVTLYVIFFSGLFTLLGTGIQLYIDYKNDFEGIENTLALIDKSHIDSLANDIWLLDETGVSTKLIEIINLPDIVYLELNATQGVIRKGKLPPANRQVTRKYEFSGRGGEGGASEGLTEVLTVVMTTEHIYQRLQDKVVIILIIQGVKTLSASIFIVFLFYMLVTRHIEKIRTFIAGTATIPLNTPLMLEKGRGLFRRTNEQDELGILVAEINAMRRELYVGEEAKKTSHEKLQREIVVRLDAEKELLHLRNYLLNVIDSMPSILIGVDLDGNVIQWNSGAEKATGLSPQVVLGQPLGQTFPRLATESQRVYDAIKSSQKQTDLKRQYQLNGETRYEEMTIYPLVAEGVEGAVIRLDDVTEKNANEAALRRAQKMEAIGQLTGGIAHDFNNILAIVMGNLEILQMTLAEGDKALKHVESALKGVRRGAGITRKLLSFSGQTASEVKRTDVNKVIANMDELISKSLTVSINVETHFEDELWSVNVDPGDLEDAILNLSLNAKDAMPEGGVLIFETSNKQLDDSYVKITPGSRCGDFVMLSVSDNGTGMTEEVKNRVLEPFFTTKGQGKGTGLGLSMVYGFAQRSGGHIKIYTEQGEGTTFNILLPRAKENIEADVKVECAFTELPRGTELILVVDDEEALVELAVEGLGYLGYSVLTASDARQALNVLEENTKIDLVFSDIIMPGKMDGYRLAAAIHKRNSACKILLASGFTKRREGTVGGQNTYVQTLEAKRLHKPYSQSELAFAIRRTLDEGEEP